MDRRRRARIRIFQRAKQKFFRPLNKFRIASSHKHSHKSIETDTEIDERKTHKTERKHRKIHRSRERNGEI